MSLLCQKTKGKVVSEICSSIFSALNTEAKSCIFMKRLTTTCVSTILHLRKIFPEVYFKTENFEGVTVKILKSGEGYKYLDKIEKWLQGAFEAIDKKYLKHLMLDIKDSYSKMTLEIYTMTFNYQKGSEALNILLSKPERNCTTKNLRRCVTGNTQIRTLRLLQMCDAVTRSCGNLPSQVTLAIRLSYHENTPKDYQPCGYKAWEPTTPVFPKTTRSIEIGVTATNHHVFRLVNKSCFNDDFFRKLDHLKTEKETRAKRELCFDNENALKKSELSIFPQDKKRRALSLDHNQYLITSKRNKTELMSDTNKNENVDEVKCPCLSPKKSDVMLLCYSCKYLVHGECFGILQFNFCKSIKFCCNLCHNPEVGLKCHDIVMTNLINSGDQQKLALLRRLLKYCYASQTTKITLKKIEEFLSSDCLMNVVETVLKKMIEIGTVIPQGRKKSYVVNQNSLRNELIHYFYKTSPSASDETNVKVLHTINTGKRKDSGFIETLSTKKHKVLNVSSKILGSQQNCTSVSLNSSADICQ